MNFATIRVRIRVRVRLLEPEFDGEGREAALCWF